ncbi:MAG: hypothetical protein K6E93_09105 [Bacteroidales bacterium]|nr:hypothetical protein [Bacteroidales bacterium]
MKKIVLLFVCTVSVICVNAQDTVALKSGEKLFVKVVASKESSIMFKYPGEDLQNEKSKREISYIVYASGRKEEIHYGLDLPVISGEDDWEKVIETYVENDVTGLTRVQELKAKSGWGGAAASNLGYKNCIKSLKKEAAKLGCSVILIHGQPTGAAAARGGNVQVIATAYK